MVVAVIGNDEVAMNWRWILAAVRDARELTRSLHAKHKMNTVWTLRPRFLHWIT
jgi:hypothetical protein